MHGNIILITWYKDVSSFKLDIWFRQIKDGDSNKYLLGCVSV